MDIEADKPPIADVMQAILKMLVARRDYDKLLAQATMDRQASWDYSGRESDRAHEAEKAACDMVEAYIHGVVTNIVLGLHTQGE